MISSNQIGSIINNQMASFGSMQGQAANIAAMGGMTPPMVQPLGFNYGGMVDPYGENQASRMGVGATAAMTAAPGMLGAGMSMAAGFGLLGHRGGMLDPMTGVMRGFGAAGRAATGIQAGSGMMMGGGWTGMKAAYSAGNLGRFMGAGMAGAAATALPYMAVGAGLQAAGSHVFGNMMQGAQQNYAAQQGLMQNFDFYNPNARSGRGFSMGQRNQISDMMRGMADADPFTDMGELNRIMVRSARGGLFQGVNSAKEFGQKFKQLVSTLKETAKVMGTSMDQALEFFDASKRMGFYNKTDILRNAQNAMVQAGGGLSARGIMQTQAAGAQMARAQGFTGAQGARLAGRAVQGVRDMVMSGQLSEEDLGEMTGGLRGQAAYRSLGRQMQSATYSLARSGVGRAVFAALAEQTGEGADRRFTGKLDQGLLKQFRSGLLSSGDIRRLASQKLMGASRETKMNFLNMQKDIQGEFASQAGPGGWMGIMSMVKSQRPGLSNEAVKLLMNRMTGLGRRQIEYIMKLYNTQDQRNYANMKRTADLLRKRAEKADMAMNMTFQGIMRQVAFKADRMLGGPGLRQAGANLAQGFTGIAQDFRDMMFGRRSTTGLDAGGQQQLLRTAMGEGGGVTANQGLLNRTLNTQTDMSSGYLSSMVGVGGLGGEVLRGMGSFSGLAQGSGRGVRLTQGSALGRGLAGAATGAAVGSFIPGLGTAIGAGIGALVGGIGGAISGGRDFIADQKKLSVIGETLSQSAMGYNEQTKQYADAFFNGQKDSLDTVRRGMETISGSTFMRINNTEAGLLSSETTHRMRVRMLGNALANSDNERVRSQFNSVVRKKMEDLRSKGLGKGMDDGQLRELARSAVIGAARKKGSSVDKILRFGEDKINNLFGGDGMLDSQRLGQAKDAADRDLATAISGNRATRTGLLGTLAAGAGGGALAGSVLGPIGSLAGAVGGSLGALGAYIMGRGKQSSTQAALQDPGQRTRIMAMLQSGPAGERARKLAMTGDDSTLKGIAENIQRMSPQQRESIRKGQARTAEQQRMLSAIDVYSGQLRKAGQGLLSVRRDELVKAGAGGLADMLLGSSGSGGLAGLMKAATTKGLAGDPSQIKNISDKQLQVVRELANMKDRDLFKLRQTGFGKTEFGIRALSARRFMTDKFGESLRGLMGITDKDKMSAQLKRLGIQGPAGLMKDLFKDISSGNIDAAKERLVKARMGAETKKSETIFQKLNGTMDNLNKTNTQMKDILIAMAKQQGAKLPQSIQKAQSTRQKQGGK